MGLVTSKNIPQFVAPSRNRRFLNSPIANLNSFDLVDYINYSICIKTGPWSGRKFAVTCGNVQCIDGVKSKSSTMAVLYRFVASILAANAREARECNFLFRYSRIFYILQSFVCNIHIV
ncbi:MAG: hypothetical protein M3Z01_02225 [Thermoproteota archaeon]|nr:hypothetical protein [Thermoproteota archaeon]